MRRKFFWVGMAWRLLIALILALCLVPISSSPVAALSAKDLFNITYEISLSKTEINGSEVFNATIQGEARCKEDLEFPYNLVSEARITGRVTATHQASGAKVTLNSSYIVTIAPFPTKKDEITQSSVVVSLQFPEESQSGTYSVAGDLIEAKVNTLIGWFTVTSYLPSSQTMGSVTYTAPGVGVGGFGPSPPTAEEVKTNLFGTEVSSPISDEGEILEEIVATSEDEYVTITIEAGTIALDIEGEPLETLTAAVEPSPPELPEDAYLIGAYDFGPDGATFDPPITLTRSYDPEAVPEGMDLVIAYYDEINDEWVWVPCEVDTENNIITASVAHFTTFAIIAVPPVVVPPAPAAFSVSSLSIQPAEVEPAEVVIIAVSVANIGGESGSYTVVLKINGVKEAEETVTIAAGSGQTVTFNVTKEEAGTYSVNIDGLSGSFIVKPAAISEPESASTLTPPATHTPPPTHMPPAKPINWPVAYGVVAALVAMGSLLFFLARRSHTKSSS